ncbi:ABC transporter permease subunit [Paenibacillus aurantius]|uniref:ABC transporter permease subunit n=1 Tax=Paenibacillus aurantius TaxID=2918900 RepID=A0AA96LEY5_9BACL|nr:ABC transporter permease subunit [Paenibacillus aurantius]WJH36658.1 ABC transporter permease subunit [Paenibacillus sp. CC-CFT747]WNQ12008.1 ABC transporter permease subunit [Paenibacillus aurantius]
MRTKTGLIKRMVEYKYMYLLVLPLAAYYVVFDYGPMYGIILAFKEFNFSKGIMGSPWIGLANFKEVFELDEFWLAFRNTIIISFGRLIFEFPVPIVVALLINEVRRAGVKKFYQVVYTFPHFLSWVIVSGIMVNFLGTFGVLNQLLELVGLQKINLLVDPSHFRSLIYTSSLWKDMGWGTIIYLAAIAGINPSLYEAAAIDGAGRFQQMQHITWPALKGTVVILLILQVGRTMSSGGGGFDQIFNLYNPAVYEKADILDTYIYRRTFALGSSYGTSTAVGLFKSVINCVLLVMTNRLAKRWGQEGIY